MIIRAIYIALLIGIISCNLETKERPFSSTEVVEMEKLRLTDLKGQSIDLKQYQGKTIFINFWATWCKPCIEEMPSIDEAQNILRNENIIFLMASAETADEIEEFANTHNYKFKYARVENFEELEIQALPTTFIFNSKRQLVFSEAGYRKWNDKNNLELILKIVKQNE